MIKFNDHVLDSAEVEFLHDVLELFIQEYDNVSRWEVDVELAKKLLNECN